MNVGQGLSVPHCGVQNKTKTFTFNQKNEEHISLFLWISVSDTEVMPAFLKLPDIEKVFCSPALVCQFTSFCSGTVFIRTIFVGNKI